MMLQAYGPKVLPTCTASVLEYYSKVNLIMQEKVMVTSITMATYGSKVIIPLTTDRQKLE